MFIFKKMLIFRFLKEEPYFARMKEKEKSSLVDLGKRLLEAARKGQAEEVSMLMASGAPFTTDWVCCACHIIM